MPENYDVAREPIQANPTKYSSIVCSTNVTGLSSKRTAVGGSTRLPATSGLYTKYNTRFDDPTYYG